nr:hypothetical protein [Serratia grimesii]
MFAYKKFRIKKWNASTRDVFGESDGMWSHEFGPTAMKLDEKRGLIHLKEENKQKPIRSQQSKSGDTICLLRENGLVSTKNSTALMISENRAFTSQWTMFSIQNGE